MIEYLLNAIRMTAGEENAVFARISEDTDPISTGCSFALHAQDGSMLAAVPGEYMELDNLWKFTIPAELTKGLSGRYWYCFQHEGQSLCFQEPLYLV